uniref:tRNA N6-adenosine threonylcarbamoyltransferase n=1 Tax=Candidatus Kentrum sp. LPFa TaxID=2126335 RepID=A0A450XST8_9GAMM|nr:MAG: N6-L-threonylcarbamoyladenine synthase [Candidatus Kentron sp. LPFa]VFK32332.1 MAG: N6-L-threonylcarbamoyladenine synthase [Candidatus Kentron sp. LPFa]
MIILGIETACDDTAVAIVRDGHDVLSSIVLTESSAHERFGGIVPELAARAQVELIMPCLDLALNEARLTLGEIDAIAVNNRHGLLRSIVVGVAAAKTLSFALGVPLIPIHHIEGHIYSALIESPSLPWPHVCLTVSGGHNLLLHAREHGEYELLGRTLDDAAGEAYDKLARRLGLGFPGGVVIDKLAAQGDSKAYPLPRPMLNDGTCDFSFSGLKTAVTNLLDEMEKSGSQPKLPDIAASFQTAVVDVLIGKVLVAVRRAGVSTVTVVGGVAANSSLRTRLMTLGQAHGFDVVCPSIKYCTDNAAMVSCAAYYRGVENAVPLDQGLEALSNAPLGDLQEYYAVKKHKNQREFASI